MTKAESVIEFIGKTAFRATLIITCSYIGATLARGDDTKPEPPTTGLMAPNYVLAPDYLDTDVGDVDEEKPVDPAQKLEYEPVTDETPLLTERSSKSEQKSGVAYEAGVDLVVSPEPDFSIKPEAIDEKVPAPVASPSPETNAPVEN